MQKSIRWKDRNHRITPWKLNSYIYSPCQQTKLKLNYADFLLVNSNKNTKKLKNHGIFIALEHGLFFFKEPEYACMIMVLL